MPHNEAVVYMEKHSKHDPPAVGDSKSPATNNTNTNREAKNSSPVFLVPAVKKKNDSPLYKYQGQKWDQVLDFDKMLKQIRSAERYYLRGRSDGGKGNFARRVQPQVQRLNAGDMHFYGMVPKKPSDVVVCDICLGIYTKMGFNNHMRLHHTQAWNSISSKSVPAASSKDTAHHSTGGSSCGGGGSNNSDNNQEITREISASGNPLAESSANATPTATSSANNSRHKSSKSGSSGGSSRSRSKSKHHHHQHQTSSLSSASASNSASSNATSSNAVGAAGAAQTAASNAEVSSSHATSSSKSSKKGTSSLNSSSNSSSTDSKLSHSAAVPKEEPTASVQPTNVQAASSSSLPNSLPSTSKVNSAEKHGLSEAAPIPSSTYVAKEKTSKASKRKSKNSSAAANAPATIYTAPEINESSNSSLEFPIIASNAPAVTATSSKSSKRSSKAKSGGKDLKQLLEPQLSELDQAVSSITGGQIDASNESSNDRSEVGAVTTAANSSLGFINATDENSLQLAMTLSTRQTGQQAHSQFSGMQVLQDANVNLQQQHQAQLQQQNSNDNDSSMLILDDEIDSKFIHEILNTDESEIHFDESELDKATAVQQQQPSYMPQPAPSKRMRYDERLATSEHGAVQQPAITGKFAAFQQQQQQPFHVTNLDDIKMYTTAQQYLSAQPSQQDQQQVAPDQHQITTIDNMQLQQLLYQQQQQQLQTQSGIGDYALDELNTAANTLEQQQFHNGDVIMCSAEQLHKEGKINAADYATLTALNNNDAYASVPNSICNINAAAAAAAAQFQVYNVPSLTDDDIIVPPNHYVLPGDSNEDEQLIYEITANNQVALISQQRQQQMIAEFLTQAGYDNVENVNMNINSSGNAVPSDTKPIITDIEPTDGLMDFDFSRLETVSSVSSSSSSSESKNYIKTETANDKYVSTAALPDDMFLNVFLYAGLPRPLALNSFGLVKLPQSVATTFRKNLHATRKANNSPVYSLSGSGSPAVTSRFGPNASNAKSFNEFSNIGSITNQSLGSQQQQPSGAQKQNSHNDFSSGNVNGLLTSAASPSTRPKSTGGKQSSTGIQLPQSQPKTIFVNTNLASAAAYNSDKFIKRSLIGKASPPLRSGPILTAKQLSDIILHPGKDSKEKYLQLLTAREQDKDGCAATEQHQQRLEHVKSFYDRRKKLMNAAANAASVTPGYSQARLMGSQLNSSSSSPTALKQKLLRERLLRTLSDCGIHSIKSTSSSPNSSASNDILRVLA